MKGLENFILANRFKEDQKRNAIYGVYHKYPIVVVYDKVHKQLLVTVNAASTTEEDISVYRDDLAKLGVEVNHVNYVHYNSGIISINIAYKKKMSEETLTTILNKVTSYLVENRFNPSCKYCRHDHPLDFYSIQGNVEVICDECYEKIVQASKENQVEQTENVLSGIIGAIIGALIGVVLWVIVYQLGFIVAIVAYLMVVCAIKGYEKLGGRLSKKGVWIAVIISIMMLLVAEYLSIGVTLYNEFRNLYDIKILEAMSMVPAFLGVSEVKALFIKDLVIGYIFMIAASYRYVINVHQSVSNEHDIKRLD